MGRADTEDGRVRFGVVARAEDRGLGIQTWEVARALRPDRVLVVDMDGSNAGFTQHFHRFADLGIPTTIVPAAAMNDPKVVGPWCSGLDVIYSAETFYRWAFCDIARAEGARTVLHLNPEFYKHIADDVNEPMPDEWWAPSPWMRNHYLMPSTRFMPMPVPFDRWTAEQRQHVHHVPTFVHVAGHPAALDRNGTRSMLQAARLVSERMSIVVVTQRPNAHRPTRLPRHVEFRNVIGGVPNYWDVPLLGDCVVLPRRYGGLCLPAIEAAGAARALIMPKIEPNWWYPAVHVVAEAHEKLRVALGELDVYDVAPRALAACMDELAGSRTNLLDARTRALDWAHEHSWELLREEWWSALAEVARS